MATKQRRASAPRPTRSRATEYECLCGKCLRWNKARGYYCEVCDK